MMDRFLIDLGYALRQLRRAPVFTLVASASLAIGIGVAVGALSFLNAIFFRPLPQPDPEGVYRVYTSDRAGRDRPYGSSSYLDYVDFERSAAFAALAAERGMRVSVAGPDFVPAQANIHFVSPNYFGAPGARPSVQCQRSRARSHHHAPNLAAHFSRRSSRVGTHTAGERHHVHDHRHCSREFPWYRGE